MYTILTHRNTFQDAYNYQGIGKLLTTKKKRVYYRDFRVTNGVL